MTNSAQPRLAARALPFPTVEHVWVLMALTLIGVLIALFPTPPHDFWWHLKAGELIANQGVPTTNLFAWTLPADQRFVYGSWLAEWLFYALYRLGGLGATVLARNLLGLAAFALVAVEARRRSGSWRLAALAALLAGAMALNTMITRPQNWAWPPFMLSVIVVGAYVDGQLRPRSLLALPLIMAFWVNVHGTFVLGLAIVALTASGETLRRLFGRPGALAWDRLRMLYVAAAAAAAATLLNPIGPGIYGYVGRLVSNRSIQELIIEWQPPAPRGISGVAFFLSILALLAAFALAQRRPAFTDVLLVCAFLWLAWGGQRNVVWYGMLAMPVLAQVLARRRPPLFRPARSLRQAFPNVLLTLLFLAALTLVQPPFKPGLPFPPPYKQLFVVLPGAPELFSADTPVAAAAYLRANPIEGRLFNEMGYGSYLDWALYPAAQVFIDTRIELYSPEFWQDYVAISEARDYNALLIGKYDVRRVLLDRARQPHLAAALAADTSTWVREYADEHAEMYRRSE